MLGKKEDTLRLIQTLVHPLSSKLVARLKEQLGEDGISVYVFDEEERPANTVVFCSYNM